MKTHLSKNNAVLHLRIPERDKQFAERLASENGISTSGLIRMALKRLKAQPLLQRHG